MERNLLWIVLNCSSHGHALGRCKVLLPPDVVMEDWPDWYQLVPAFVATYGTDELQELEGGVLLEAIEEQDDVSLTKADRAYLKALETWLGMYPEMRTTK
jgi:hypothetical protein